MLINLVTRVLKNLKHLKMHLKAILVFLKDCNKKKNFSKRSSERLLQRGNSTNVSDRRKQSKNKYRHYDSRHNEYEHENHDVQQGGIHKLGVKAYIREDPKSEEDRPHIPSDTEEARTVIVGADPRTVVADLSDPSTSSPCNEV